MKKKESSTAIDHQVQFLKKISFFRDFGDHELRQLLSVSRWLKVPPGTLIIKEESLEKVFYILVKGNVVVFVTGKNGKRTKLTTLTTGDTFGEMALVSETKRTAGVETTQESFILMVEPDILNQTSVFLQLKFYRRFCEILVSRLVAANKKMSTLHESTPPSTDYKTFTDKRQKTPLDKGAVKKEKQNPPVPQIAIDISELPPIPPLQAVAKAKMKKRIQEDTNLPINPTIAARLTAFINDDSEDTRKFADLINCDPVLAAKVIQHANSTFYRRSSAVNSVPHAMITIGITQLQKIVAKELLNIGNEEKILGGFFLLSDRFWLHAVVVGRIAELLKEAIGLNISDDVHLAGLLHDMGQLSLDRQQPLFYPQLFRPNFIKQNISLSEKNYVGIDHGPAGAWVGEKMRLSAPYLDVMQYHHSPEKAQTNFLLVALVHLADLFAKERGIQLGNPEPDNPPLSSSFGWALIQEHHKAFIDVDLNDFICSFNFELDRRWEEISRLLPA